MNKFSYLLAVLFVSVVCSAETSQFTYAEVHTLGGYPMAGAGYRALNGVHGFDVSANICPVRMPQTLKIFHVRSLYLYYPMQRGFYFGGGLGIINEPETVKVSGSFESSVGYQWASQIFLEANATVPFKQYYDKVPIYPCITLGYGF